MKSGILILRQIRTGNKSRIMFELTDEAYTRDKAMKFFMEKMSREKKTGKDYLISAEFEIHYQRRTMAQNNLLRALERIMAFEQDGTEETYQEYHEGLVEKYCPPKDRKNPVTLRSQRKRTSELNTVEMAQVIGGAFFELATMGVEITTGNIANYWIEWYNWRGKQSADPFTEKARTIDQYRKDVPVCEACLKGLVTRDEYGKDRYAGQIAHIVSRGSGGSDEIWNLMHLCTDCHLHLQHQNGWLAIINRFPHIAWRVATAQIKSGRVAAIDGEEGWEPVMKEVRRIERMQHDDAVDTVADVFNGEVVESSEKDQPEEEGALELDIF
jgi:hypothetical protein